MKQNENKRNQRIIGITGGIGAGKSTAIDYLEKKGFPIIDADDISRLIVFPDSEASKQIEYAFGREYFHDDGLLNRPKLAGLIFHDSNQRQKLNDIMFPLIWTEIHRQIAEIFQDSNIHTVFVEAAVLIESGGLDYVDEVWVVASDEAVRLERITKRDHLDTQSAQARINSQIPQEQNIVHANVVLNNSHDEQTLYKQIDLLI